ncbi:MAG: hypothetical protein HRU19_11240 [Pseudobacteriovorax sp.]|nr:hypothetical protein [Pseudobacteriovorax sp.]
MKTIIAALMLVASTQAYSQTELRIAPYHSYLEIIEPKATTTINGVESSIQTSSSYENTAGLSLGLLLPAGQNKISIGLSHQEYHYGTLSHLSFLALYGRIHIPFSDSLYGIGGASLNRTHYKTDEFVDWNNPIILNAELGLGWSKDISSSMSFFVEAIHSRTIVSQDLESDEEVNTFETFQVTLKDLNIQQSNFLVGLGFKI